jgi:molybdenum cofactor cytidylyltransferase
MEFGPVPLETAQGAVLAHSVALKKGRLRKGVVLTAAHLADLRDMGVSEVTVARLGPGDVDENTAAARIAAALVPDAEAAGLIVTDPFTGRVNLLAGGPGVVRLEPQALMALNRIDPMLTLATVPQHQQMGPRGMVGTVKIIAYGLPETAVAAAETLLKGHAPIKLARPTLRDARLIVTEIPGGAGEKGVPAIRDRVEALGMELSQVVTVPHQEPALTKALRDGAEAADLTLILTGSATSDPRDVAPSAVVQAGGRIERFGMPVDPGNLLFLGDLFGRPVIGLPGCVRSPQLNGADWVLSQIACGITVSDADIAGMGIGGLLKEIPTRPQPRAGKKPTS